MTTIYDDKFITIELHDDSTILIYTWKPTSANLTVEKLFAGASKVLTAVLENKVQKIIGYDINFLYPIAPAVQVELNNAILTNINNTIVKKFAHVESSEMISQLSVEQFFDENTQKTYEDKYFDNLNDALNWCKQ